jgi:hypothetical protein
MDLASASSRVLSSTALAKGPLTQAASPQDFHTNNGHITTRRFVELKELEPRFNHGQ